MKNIKIKFVLSILIYILLIFTENLLHAQDIYNVKNSEKYAWYLYKSGNFSVAAKEFERILFLDSLRNDLRLTLAKSYRKSGQYEQAVQNIIKFNNNIATMNAHWNKEYILNLINLQEYKPVLKFLNSNIDLKPDEKAIYCSIAFCFDDRWDKAMQQFVLDTQYEPNNTYSTLNSLFAAYSNEKKKNTTLAIGLSVLVPGLGKVYSGNWKDGIFSLIAVSVSGIQAYRGFKKKGINSGYGWAYLTLGTGFYLGNIYGSAKAVNKYNKEIKHKYLHKVEDIFHHID